MLDKSIMLNRQVIEHCLSSFSCQMAYQVVIDSPDFKSKWTAAVEWLNDELERVIVGNIV